MLPARWLLARRWPALASRNRSVFPQTGSTSTWLSTQPQLLGAERHEGRAKQEDVGHEASEDDEVQESC